MSVITENLADKLAQDVIKASEETGDEQLIDEIARALGTSSPTTEEMFRTFVRVRLAEQRARRLLAQKLAMHQASTAPEPQS